MRLSNWSWIKLTGAVVVCSKDQLLVKVASVTQYREQSFDNTDNYVKQGASVDVIL